MSIGQPGEAVNRRVTALSAPRCSRRRGSAAGQANSASWPASCSTAVAYTQLGAHLESMPTACASDLASSNVRTPCGRAESLAPSGRIPDVDSLRRYVAQQAGGDRQCRATRGFVDPMNEDKRWGATTVSGSTEDFACPSVQGLDLSRRLGTGGDHGNAREVRLRARLHARYPSVASTLTAHPSLHAGGQTGQQRHAGTVSSHRLPRGQTPRSSTAA